MSLYKELSYDNYIDGIKGIQFSIMGPEEIMKRSVVHVNKSEAFNNNIPVANGLYDSKMGVIDFNQICPTCLQKNTFCPGHFGHIELAKPVFHIQFWHITRRLLRCICTRCSKALVDPNSDEVKAILNKKYSRQKRWELLYKLCSKKKRCGQDTLDGCGAKVPKITRDTMLKIALEWKDESDKSKAAGAVVNKQVLSAEDVLHIFRRISDADADMLGFSPKFSRPENMICTVFPVLPPTARPSVRNDTGVRQEDDLTHKLSTIVKTNDRILKKMKKGSDKMSNENIEIETMVLQWEIATMIDNTQPGIPQSKQRTGRCMRSLTERLKSKEGRIRGNLMGKRVDYSGRSVITPDPNIRMDQLGVPYKIAMNLTFPEIVNKYNIEEMKKLVKNGPDIYPGAKSIKKQNSSTYRLKSNNDKEIAIELGDVVDRHLRNDDVVLFNRQPSLHRMSMMSHYVVVMPFDTFRLNVTVTPSYNADFDGDEMNVHVPQSLQTQEELIQLSAVSTQIISPSECKPIVSVVQDIATGLYAITKDHVTLSEKQLFNLMCLNPKGNMSIPEPSLNKGKKNQKWTGHQILSTIIPDKVNIEYKDTDRYDDKKTALENKNATIKIKNGECLSGAFDKTVYQAGTRGIVHQVFNEYGPEETRDLFDNTQQLICGWLVHNGFSVGVSDMVLDPSTIDIFKNITHKMKVAAYEKIAEVHKKGFENNTTKSNQEKFEEEVNKILNKAVNEIGKEGLSQIDEKHNRLINMIKAKAKGSHVNVAQMIGCVGQQNVDGKRMPYGFDNRTLPHYTKFDDGPKSRGFIENSFISGLSPQEFYFAAMGGREGLIDTAVGTSETGYLQRKLVKAMEDCKVNYDGTVRNAGGNIVQFLYGEDGMDPTKVEKQRLETVDMTPEQIINEFQFSPTFKELSAYYTPEMINKMKKDDKLKTRLAQHTKQLLEDRDFVIVKMFKKQKESTLMYPVSFNRIITIASNTQNKHGVLNTTDLEPEHILDKIEEVCAIIVNKNQPANKVFSILARCYLSPKKVILKHRLQKGTFDLMIEQIKFRFYESLVHPSEMVGVIAAQSIGEPSTQLTLNSVEWNTEILIDEDGALRRARIGEMIDHMLSETPKQYIEEHDNQTTLGWIKEKNIKILSCDENGLVGWKRVEAITQHPPINADGSSLLVKVVTKSGREVIATKAKSFLKRKDNKILPVRGDELVVGDFLPVSSQLPMPPSLCIDCIDIIDSIDTLMLGGKEEKKGVARLDAAFGTLMGAYLARGSTDVKDGLVRIKTDILVSDKHKIDSFCLAHDLYREYKEDGLSIKSDNLVSLLERLGISSSAAPRVPVQFYGAPEEFKEAVVMSFLLYSNVAYTEYDSEPIFEDKKTVEDCQQLMVSIGIQSTISMVQDPRDGKMYYSLNIVNKAFALIPDIVTKEFGTISLPRFKIQEYIQKCKFEEDKRVFEDILKENIMYDQIESITEVESEHPFVYDLTVQDTKNFNIHNGLAIRDTFHSSGIGAASKAVRGVPRLKELLDMTKDIRSPEMVIHFKNHIAHNKAACLQVINDIRTIYFKDIVKSIRVYFDPDDFNTNVPSDKPLIDMYRSFHGGSDGNQINRNVSPWLLRIEFDKGKMNVFNLDMVKIHQSLDRFYEDRIWTVGSDDNAEELVMRIKLNLSNEKAPASEEDVLTELRALEFYIMESFPIKGVSKIMRATLAPETRMTKYNPVTKVFDSLQSGEENEKEKEGSTGLREWLAITEGSNLQKILGMDAVDAVNTISNDVNEVYAVLGIEAARTVIYNEIIEVLDNIYVNYRHVALLIDVMTNKGNILSVNRHGINRGDIGPLAKCSFEETTDKLVKAGIFADYDKMNGVAANIMLGQIAPAGTGDMDIYLDETMLPKVDKRSVLETLREEEEEEGEKEGEGEGEGEGNGPRNEDEDDICIEDTFDMNIDVKKSTNEPIERKQNTSFTIV